MKQTLKNYAAHQETLIRDARGNQVNDKTYCVPIIINNRQAV
jgi:hypothetical protein